jgi:hypothetical protein
MELRHPCFNGVKLNLNIVQRVMRIRRADSLFLLAFQILIHRVLFASLGTIISDLPFERRKRPFHRPAANYASSPRKPSY